MRLALPAFGADCAPATRSPYPPSRCLRCAAHLRGDAFAQVGLALAVLPGGFLAIHCERDGQVYWLSANDQRAFLDDALVHRRQIVLAGRHPHIQQRPLAHHTQDAFVSRIEQQHLDVRKRRAIRPVLEPQVHVELRRERMRATSSVPMPPDRYGMLVAPCRKVALGVLADAWALADAVKAARIMTLTQERGLPRKLMIDSPV